MTGSDHTARSSAAEVAPLIGIRVVDFSTTLPGPYCSSILRRLGAEVISLEPSSGDALRLQPEAHAAVGRGKHSAVVNLKDPDDRRRALRLVEGADAVLEGWRPGVADRLGVGPADCLARNAALVYCSLSGYGAEGPLAGRAGHDLNFVAEAGALDLCARSGFPVADLATGMMAAVRVVAALLQARATGHGCVIDVSATATVRDWVEALGGGQVGEFVSSVAGMPQYGVFPTADGYRLVLGVASENRLWSNLITALGRPEWADLSPDERVASGVAIREYLRTVIASQSAAELTARLADVDTCWNFAREPSDPLSGSGGLPWPSAGAPALGEHNSLLHSESAGRA